MTPLTILRGARELLSVPERWTQGAFARNDRGDPVYLLSPDACAWCLAGAIRRSVGEMPGWLALARECFGYIVNVRTDGLVASKLAAFNDAPERTHADVLRALDAAIALATTRDGGGE